MARKREVRVTIKENRVNLNFTSPNIACSQTAEKPEPWFSLPSWASERMTSAGTDALEYWVAAFADDDSCELGTA